MGVLAELFGLGTGRLAGRSRLSAILLLAAAVELTGQGVAVANRQEAKRRPLPAGMTAPAVDFQDVAAAAGLAGVNVSGAEQDKRYIVESTGNGVALLDYDGDGLLDIFLVNAARLEEPDSPPRHLLYRNLGGLRFEDASAGAEIPATGWGQGVCAGDVDGDSHEDLFLPHWGANVLLRNQGDGTFADESERWRLAGDADRWSLGCAFLDYDRDGDQDLFVANYLRFDQDAVPEPGETPECQWKGAPVLCGPRGLPGETMSLYRNDGDVFTDVSQEAGVAIEREYYGMTPLTGDFDNDGWVDVYVACDSSASLLYRNTGEGGFEEMGVLSGAAYNSDGMEQAGMGVAAGDFDRDGDFDIFKTNFSSDIHTLYRNEGDWILLDETIRTGLGVNTAYVGWGAAFFDFDNDGWQDLLAVNGHVYPNIERTSAKELFRQPRLLYWNRGDGEFHDISRQAGPGVSARRASRGLAVGDLDNDGRQEAVVVNMHQAPSLLVNRAEQGGAILIEVLDENGSAALGARVMVTTPDGARQLNEVRSGGSYISHGDTRLHFGLGAAEQAVVRVERPGRAAPVELQVRAGSWVALRPGLEPLMRSLDERRQAVEGSGDSR